MLFFSRVREQHSYTNLQVHNKDALKDIWDRKVVTKSDPMSLGLILYQDSFEINPLGSGKKKHKRAVWQSVSL